MQTLLIQSHSIRADPLTPNFDFFRLPCLEFSFTDFRDDSLLHETYPSIFRTLSTDHPGLKVLSPNNAPTLSTAHVETLVRSLI